MRKALVDCYIAQRLARLVNDHQVESIVAGRPLGPETSLGKLWRSDNGRLATALVSELAFDEGTAWDAGDPRDDWTFAILDACRLSLGGGTDEV